MQYCEDAMLYLDAKKKRKYIPHRIPEFPGFVSDNQYFQYVSFLIVIVKPKFCPFDILTGYHEPFSS